ncbi:uncharacterized protein LOC101449224 [Ceratitis capitata]|uniref:uncharacterized protein LOC101449224 n=1 Tax=Ceratitis capitata TaxID=7213 RepID=UPI000329E00C|nr:uncharacterized protein LOC101449224 [Ceratitis capitata]
MVRLSLFHAVKNFPVTTDKKSLQRFLGLTSYFRRFVEGYAVVAKPLSDLLRKDKRIVLQEQQLASLQQLKRALVSAPVLNLYNPKAVTEVHTDACIEMRLAQLDNMREVLDEEEIAELDKIRDETRAEAKRTIETIQEENRKTFNLKRKPGKDYELNAIAAIKRTQYGTGMKLRAKYLGPYKIFKKIGHGRYEVEKVGDYEGPHRTITVAEYMKPWT